MKNWFSLHSKQKIGLLCKINHMINKIIKYINIRGFYLLIQDIQNSSSRSKQNFGLLRITMEDLKVLKRKRKD